MIRKTSEPSFVELAKRYGWRWHKYGDVRYCIHCNKPLPKSEKAPDYLLAPVSTWVECKNNNATGRWNWKDDIGPEGKRKNQREWLQTHGGWLFIELGKGRAPKGRGAFLVPWVHWVNFETALLSTKQYSLRWETTGTGKALRVGAHVMLEKYALEWNEGGWIIPGTHVFWSVLHSTLRDLVAEVEKITGNNWN